MDQETDFAPSSVVFGGNDEQNEVQNEASSLVQVSPSHARSFKAQGWLVIRKLLVPGDCKILCEKFNGALEKSCAHDEKFPNSRQIYKPSLGEFFLQEFCPLLGHALEVDLLPAFSFLHSYGKGDRLPAHRDRVPCEITTSITLSDNDWPICLEDHAKIARSVHLRSGGAVIFKGMELLHWRDPLEDNSHMQLILQYVDANGPMASYAHDPMT